jgi:hypothetical protein
LSFNLSFAEFGSKFVPVIVTGVPGVAIAGLKLAMLGCPVAVTTLNGDELVALPKGLVTEMVPDVAALGTVTRSWFELDEVTVADEPLKVTEFWLATVLKPVPYIVTVVPVEPLVGVK